MCHSINTLIGSQENRILLSIIMKIRKIVTVNNCQIETKNNRAQSIYVNNFQECIDEMTLTKSSKSTSNLGS